MRSREGKYLFLDIAGQQRIRRLQGSNGTGRFIYVPPFVPYQEINASKTEPCEAVVVRNDQETVVVNLPIDTPEPVTDGGDVIPFHSGWSVRGGGAKRQ